MKAVTSPSVGHDRFDLSKRLDDMVMLDQLKIRLDDQLLSTRLGIELFGIHRCAGFKRRVLKLITTNSRKIDHFRTIGPIGRKVLDHRPSS